MTYEECGDALRKATTKDEELGIFIELVLSEVRAGRIFRICPKCGKKYSLLETECPHCREEQMK